MNGVEVHTVPETTGITWRVVVQLKLLLFNLLHLIETWVEPELIPGAVPLSTCGYRK